MPLSKEVIYEALASVLPNELIQFLNNKIRVGVAPTSISIDCEERALAETFDFLFRKITPFHGIVNPGIELSRTPGGPRPYISESYIATVCVNPRQNAQDFELLVTQKLINKTPEEKELIKAELTDIFVNVSRIIIFEKCASRTIYTDSKKLDMLKNAANVATLTQAIELNSKYRQIMSQNDAPPNYAQLRFSKSDTPTDSLQGQQNASAYPSHRR